MEHIELILLGLLVAIATLAVLARVLHVPYPILLVAGGVGIGFLPGVPSIELQPDVVLLIFLPPLLYAAAFFSSIRELRRNAGQISLLAIGLVVATMVSIAAVGHFAIGMSWPVAFVLGAIVSPTDAVAPAAIVRRLGVPRRLVTLIEGENLTNDWTALVLYKFAVAAVVTGAFSLPDAVPQFLLTGLGGVAIGLAVGWLIAQVRRRLEDPPTEITISLLTGYAAYLPAEELGFSGVIAAVTIGIYMGWRAPELISPTTRLQVFSVWEVLQFLVNAVLFLLIGLQLPAILDSLRGVSAGELAGTGALVGGVVIAVRLAWVFGLTGVARRLSASLRARDPDPWGQVAVLAWSGMRGSVSLAAALAIPLSTTGGSPFPERDLIIFLTFCAILATLVGQGVTLPLLIRLLGVEDDRLDHHEERYARMHAARVALQRIDELADEEWVREDTADRMRGLFDYRRRRFEAAGEGDGIDYELRSEAYVRFMREVIAAQRGILVELRNTGTITDEVMRKVERDLDLEESRLIGAVG